MRSPIHPGRAVLAAITLCLGLPATQARAQDTGARVVQLPDTLGAAFSIADSATKSGDTTDFNFLVGMWQFRFQVRRANGTYQQPFTGHWYVEKRNVRGAMIEDHWRADNPTATWDDGDYTYRVWAPRRKLWVFQGVTADEGIYDPGISWSDATSRYVVQFYPGYIMRIRYFDITPYAFKWRADRSVDNGVTWIRDWWIMDARRIAR